MGNNVLNYEELLTFFCQVEVALNHRLINFLNDDSKDELPLSPAAL